MSDPRRSPTHLAPRRSDRVPRRRRRSHDDSGTADRERTARTIPRGRDADDASTVPGVDPAVWELHVRYDRTRDPSTLEALVDEYERYALSIAQRFRRVREPREDLDQVAREALVLALGRFDPERALPFASYATPTIAGSLRRHYRDHGWSVRVPRRVHEITVATRTVSERLTSDLGRPPTVQEVVDELGITIDELLHAQEAVHARETVSLDAPVAEDGGALHERISVEDRAVARTDNRIALTEAIAELGDRDRGLLDRYYFQEQSQSEIARHLGVSQMQVSRLLADTLRRLRAHMGPR